MSIQPFFFRKTISRKHFRRPSALLAKTMLGGVSAFLLSIITSTGIAQDSKLVIVHETEDAKVIKINIDGLTGEVNSTVRFDLYVAGFDFVEASEAQYLIKGANTDSAVTGQLKDKVNQGFIIPPTSYTGGGGRVLAHTFAGAVIEKLRNYKAANLTKIAFKVDHGGSKEIYVADYDGNNATAITSDHSLVAAPCWAPGKRAVYYTSYLRNNPDIYLQELKSGDRKVIARYPGLNSSASVSPDGSRLAMILSKSGSPDVWVANADGTSPKQLTTTAAEESSPCWSPDGSTICFVSNVSGRRALYTMPSSGGVMTRLNTSGISNPSEPDWSPDGKTIIFTAQMGSFSVCKVDATGGVAEILTEGEDPSWAANSKQVIYTRRSGDRRFLSVLDVGTKHHKDIKQVSGNSSQPSWAK